MAALERGIEWLRPLVSSNQPREYCVIWKLGDDPSRFMEWGPCCCSGGRMGEDSSENKRLIDECRDDSIKHAVSSNACKKLAQLPSVIPLYSGCLSWCGEMKILSSSCAVVMYIVMNKSGLLFLFLLMHLELQPRETGEEGMSIVVYF